MSEWRKIRSLGIEREGQAYYIEYDEGPPGDHQFRVETLYTGLSAGTELTFFKGTNPYLHSRWDEGFGIFQDGHPSAHYPLPFLGYYGSGPRDRDAHAACAGWAGVRYELRPQDGPHRARPS